MKKSLLALSALAATGVASAQSSVMLFGIIDAAISNYSTKSTFQPTSPLQLAPLTAPGDRKQSQTALANSGYNSSRLGFRGAEDLGGGLAASFWLEAGVLNDDGRGAVPGTEGGFAFNRRSTLSLSSSFGELRLGRDYTPTFYNDTVFDPLGTNGVGSNLIFNISGRIATNFGPGSAVSASDTYPRTSNAISYFLPLNLGGFYGQAMYALPETVNISHAIGSPSQKGRLFGGRFGYADGPLDIAAAYSQSTAADLATVGSLGQLVSSQNRKIDIFNLGASYDFGSVKLLGEISQTRDRNELGATPPIGGLPFYGTAVQTDKYNGYLLGVLVPVGTGVIRASYSSMKYRNGAAQAPSIFNTDNGDARTSQLAVGYVHNLSKRTALYATLSHISLKNASNNPQVMGAVTGGTPGYLTTGGYAPKSATGYNFGIRHAF